MLERESRARNHSDCRASTTFAGCMAVMALQPRLGLLPFRHAGTGAGDRGGAGAARAGLSLTETMHGQEKIA